MHSKSAVILKQQKMWNCVMCKSFLMQLNTTFHIFATCNKHDNVIESNHSLRGSLCKNLMTSLDQETDSSQTL